MKLPVCDVCIWVVETEDVINIEDEDEDETELLESGWTRWCFQWTLHFGNKVQPLIGPNFPNFAMIFPVHLFPFDPGQSIEKFRSFKLQNQWISLKQE
jgi:hypothetical protein